MMITVQMMGDRFQDHEITMKEEVFFNARGEVSQQSRWIILQMTKDQLKPRSQEGSEVSAL